MTLLATLLQLLARHPKICKLFKKSKTVKCKTASYETITLIHAPHIHTSLQRKPFTLTNIMVRQTVSVWIYFKIKEESL